MKRLDSLEIMPTRIRIASILRKVILSGEFKEGEGLSLTDIANNLDVSGTPVREALQILSSENLILLRMSKGAIVKGITTKTVREHFEMRLLLKRETTIRATLRRFGVSELMESQVHIESLGENFTDDEYQSYNQNLHTSIWKAADNSEMYSALSSLQNGNSLRKTVSAKGHQTLSIRKHRDILECTQSCNPYLVRKEMEHHVERSMSDIINGFSLKENEQKKENVRSLAHKRPGRDICCGPGSLYVEIKGGVFDI